MTPKEELIIKFNHIILIQGFSNFSMVDLAKKADISRAKLYLYFKNKDEIVNSVVDRHMEFLTKYPVPNEASDNNLMSTILNSLLLLGSSTDLFEQELKQKYPQLYRDFRRGYDQYLIDLQNFYQDAQKSNLVINTVSSDFLLYQNKISIRGILDDVRTNQINLEQGEKYLREYFIYQIHSLFVNKNLVESDEVKNFVKNIIKEYYDTYSLINN